MFTYIRPVIQTILGVNTFSPPELWLILSIRQNSLRIT